MIHEDAKDRIKSLTKDDLLELMEDAAVQADAAGEESGVVLLSYIDQNDNFEVGTYVPEVWLIVRRVLE